MKKIIAISCFIVVLTLFNYPVLNSEGISYFIIFLCLVLISFAGAKIYFPSNYKDSYETVEKEMDHLHSNDGIFQYTKEGFYIKQTTTQEHVKWNEIVSVNTFRILDISYDKQSVLEIITDKKRYEFNYKETSGIEKLVDKLYDHLSDWKLDSPTLIVNNSGLQKTELYKRKNL